MGKSIENRIEVVQRKEQDVTCVPLFRYGKMGLEQSRSFYKAAGNFAAEYKRNDEYWAKKGEKLIQVRERMEINMVQLSNQLIASTSFVTCDLAYLKFLDDFEVKGLSEGEVFDFFKLCLSINIRKNMSN